MPKRKFVWRGDPKAVKECERKTSGLCEQRYEIICPGLICADLTKEHPEFKCHFDGNEILTSSEAAKNAPAEVRKNLIWIPVENKDE